MRLSFSLVTLYVSLCSMDSSSEMKSMDLAGLCTVYRDLDVYRYPLTDGVSFGVFM